MMAKKNFLQKAMASLLALVMIIPFVADMSSVEVNAAEYSIGEGDGFSVNESGDVTATFTVSDNSNDMRGWLLCLFSEEPSVDGSTNKLVNSGNIHPYSHNA